MLMPKRVKYRRQHRGRMKGKATRGNFVAYGQYGIQATEPCWITSNQIEAARIAINRRLRRGGKVWIKIFPDKPVTKKPAGPAWVKEKVHLNIGLPLSNRGEFYLKLQVFQKQWPESYALSFT